MDLDVLGEIQDPTFAETYLVWPDALPCRAEPLSTDTATNGLSRTTGTGDDSVEQSAREPHCRERSGPPRHLAGELARDAGTTLIGDVKPAGAMAHDPQPIVQTDFI